MKHTYFRHRGLGRCHGMLYFVGFRAAGAVKKSMLGFILCGRLFDPFSPYLSFCCLMLKSSCGQFQLLLEISYHL